MGALDQISWKVLLAMCNIGILKFGSVPTARSKQRNPIHHVPNIMIEHDVVSLSLSQS
jgi:hypothetical protein